MNHRSSIYFTPPALSCSYMAPATVPLINNAGYILSIQIPSDHFSAVSTTLRSTSMKYVEGLLALEDGWDGYGGYAPSRLVCDHATRLIGNLAREFPSLPSPDISPSSNGTVLLTWEATMGTAVLEIGDLKFSGYIRRSDSSAPLSGEAQQLGKNELSIIAGCLL
jgi:hypothetical protein